MGILASGYECGTPLGTRLDWTALVPHSLSVGVGRDLLQGHGTFKLVAPAVRV